ncbi:DNA polymerase III subunit delta' [Flavobacterium sp.]|uniref:DNA polymerase III subunit n=1 Tax=Flavobacterium sp. TaxID=239 RepID=UPI001B6DDB7E|nr:DNA polymerase III subunit delta' [Flavobacterium sp.]MBP6128469.1 DNA polymerase III subunit delta' [Flavobacterium sp.]
MLFKDILGQDHIKNYLITTANAGRIPHAQLFIGPEGSGTLPMAMAYAQYILCNNSDGENTTGNSACNLKFEHISHPDMHFVYPITSTDEVKGDSVVSTNFLDQWRSFVKENPYGSLFDWYKKLEIPKKQGIISVKESAAINKNLSLKAYEGGYKVMIIWMADKMRTDAANKLLKLLEEPPEKTIFILISESIDDLLQTIISRCQVVDFLALPEQVITNALIATHKVEANLAKKIAHQCEGNYNKALHLLHKDDDDSVFEEWFINWVRAAFKAKGNASVIADLISWSATIAKEGRETQKNFLQFCIQFFRQALLLNYQATDLVYLQPNFENFKLEKFAPFVHGNNIMDIFKELEDAMYHIERNGNSNIILTDLSIKLTRLLHKKEV